MSFTVGGTYVGASTQIANSIITNAKLAVAGNNLLLVETLTLAGVTTISTSVTMSGKKNYLILGNITSAAGAFVNLYVNADTTDAHYYVQNLGADGAGISGGRNNNAYIAYANTAASYFIARCGVSQSNHFVMFGESVNSTTPIFWKFDGSKTDATVTGITSLTFTCAQNMTGTILVYEVIQ